MNLSNEDLKKEYKNKGFFVVKNFLNINPKFLLNDILSASSTDRYNDKYSKPRRIERIFDKSESLVKLNNDIICLLENIFQEKMTIFKDKFNSKPPGGEGFYAHYDGIFLWKDKNNFEKNGWYEYLQSLPSLMPSLIVYPAISNPLPK